MTFYFDLSFPVKRIKTVHNKNKKDWISQGIRISSLKLKELYKKMVHTKNQSDKLAYDKYKRIYKKVIKTAKRLHNDRLINKASNKSKVVWSIINKNVNSPKYENKPEIKHKI